MTLNEYMIKKRSYKSSVHDNFEINHLQKLENEQIFKEDLKDLVDWNPDKYKNRIIKLKWQDLVK